MKLLRWLLIRSDTLQAIYFRYRCPYPIGHRSARECVRAGECGCCNQFRYGR